MKHVFLAVVQNETQSEIFAEILGKKWCNLNRSHVDGSSSANMFIDWLKNANENSKFFVTSHHAGTLLFIVEEYWPKTGPRRNDVEGRIFDSLRSGAMMQLRIPRVRSNTGKRKEAVTCTEVDVKAWSYSAGAVPFSTMKAE